MEKKLIFWIGFFILISQIEHSNASNCFWNTGKQFCVGNIALDFNLTKCWLCDGNQRIPNENDSVSFRDSSKTPYIVAIPPSSSFSVFSFSVGSLATLIIRPNGELKVNSNLTVNNRGNLIVFGQLFGSKEGEQTIVQIEGLWTMKNGSEMGNAHIKMDGRAVFETNFKLSQTKTEASGLIEWNTVPSSGPMTATIDGAFTLNAKSTFSIYGDNTILINSINNDATFSNNGIIRVNCTNTSKGKPHMDFNIKFQTANSGVITAMSSLTINFLRDSDYFDRNFVSFSSPVWVVFGSSLSSSVHQFHKGVNFFEEKEKENALQSGISFGSPDQTSKTLIKILANSSTTIGSFFVSPKARVVLSAKCNLVKFLCLSDIQVLGSLEGEQVKRKGEQHSTLQFKSISSKVLVPSILGGNVSKSISVVFDSTKLSLANPNINGGLSWINTQFNISSLTGTKGSGTIQIANNSKMFLDFGKPLNLGELTVSFISTSFIQVDVNAQEQIPLITAAKISFHPGITINVNLLGVPELGKFYQIFHATAGTSGIDGRPKFLLSTSWRCGLDWSPTYEKDSIGVTIRRVKPPTPPSGLQIVNQPQFPVNTLVWIPSVIACNSTFEYYNITIVIGNQSTTFTTTNSYMSLDSKILPSCTFAMLYVKTIVTWKGAPESIITSNTSIPYPSFVLPVSSKPAQPIVSNLTENSAVVTWENVTNLGDACNATISSVEIRVTMKEKPTPYTVNLPASQSSFEFPGLL
eukprot:TRINITY_DN5040_c0_g2_i4.p1 TRINITY_DN5040_c0_g2~~TRINITY_DN5040_c0_g2_i4.p1  ORF type:complete len:749 (+),score=211.23 TRINITY_DN5040_c0_g2_i4:89-2335(+)